MKFPTPGGGGDRSIPGHPAWTSGNQSACSVIKLRSEQEAFAVLSGWDRKCKSRISKKKTFRHHVLPFSQKKTAVFLRRKVSTQLGQQPKCPSTPGAGKSWLLGTTPEGSAGKPLHGRQRLLEGEDQVHRKDEDEEEAHAGLRLPDGDGDVEARHGRVDEGWGSGGRWGRGGTAARMLNLMRRRFSPSFGIFCGTPTRRGTPVTPWNSLPAVAGKQVI